MAPMGSCLGSNCWRPAKWKSWIESPPTNLNLSNVFSVVVLRVNWFMPDVDQLRHDPQRHMRWKPRRAVDALPRPLEITVLGLKNVGHIFLRVAVDQREPGAVDLHHDAVAFPEAVMVPVQVDGVFVHFFGDDRLGLLEA